MGSPKISSAGCRTATHCNVIALELGAHYRDRQMDTGDIAANSASAILREAFGAGLRVHIIRLIDA